MSARAIPPVDASVHMLKITLVDVEPPVWRRLLVPSSTTLARLHSVIQRSMGWMDAHLYEFEIGATRYGLDDEDEDLDEPFVDAQKATLAVAPAGTSFVYRYDFGDDWAHQIDVEEVFVAEKEARYPSCVDGQGACPPEDVGGPQGYEHFLVAIADPTHKEHDDYLDWVGGPFDPARFDLEDAKERRVSRKRTFRK